MSDTQSTVREVLAAHGRLGTDAAGLDADADLYAAGMTSHASVNVMMACEDELDVEFPDEMLNRETFATINSITRAVDSLR
ncbi:acyl carrier protein [Luteococcus peritonei]|uniref:Acyl carrier protein n=1 Tax=Luteococcus peritonei TaxID=88874 RepID=A0ABW4RUG7_9ACTN